MRSDVSEFLKTAKPSLVSLLARQAQWEGHRDIGKSRSISTPAVIATALIIGVVILGGFIAYRKIGPGPFGPVLEEAAAPPAFIFFEGTTELTLGKTRQELLGALREAGLSQQPVGSFRRLIIRVGNNAGAASVIEIGEFLELTGMRLPAAFSASVVSPPQFFIYRQSSGPAFGMMVETRSPGRALQGLISSEPSLQRDLEVMFLGSPPPSVLEPFRDVTYKNIDFRYLGMGETNGRGLGYLHFPAKRLIVIATSQEALQRTIERLFADR